MGFNDTVVTVVAPGGVDDGNGTVVSVATPGQATVTTLESPRYHIRAPELVALATTGRRPIGGGFVLQLSGLNLFGAGLTAFVPTVDVGPAPCRVIVGSVTPSAVSCVAPAGVGAGINVSVTLLGRTAVLVAALSYDAPVVLSLSPSTSDARAASVIDVYGDNFASPPYLAVVVDGGVCAALEFKNHSHVVCTLRGGMTLGPHGIRVFSGNLVSNVGGCAVLSHNSVVWCRGRQ